MRRPATPFALPLLAILARVDPVVLGLQLEWLR